MRDTLATLFDHKPDLHKLQRLAGLEAALTEAMLDVRTSLTDRFRERAIARCRRIHKMMEDLHRTPRAAEHTYLTRARARSARQPVASQRERRPPPGTWRARRVRSTSSSPTSPERSPAQSPARSPGGSHRSPTLSPALSARSTSPPAFSPRRQCGTKGVKMARYQQRLYPQSTRLRSRSPIDRRGREVQADREWRKAQRASTDDLESASDDAASRSGLRRRYDSAADASTTRGEHDSGSELEAGSGHKTRPLHDSDTMDTVDEFVDHY